MLAISSANLELAGGWVAHRPRRERPTAGLVCSVLLHIVVALLLIFGPTTDTRPPPDIEEAIPAELVMQGETTAPVIQPNAAQPVEAPRPTPAQPVVRPVEVTRPAPPKPAPLAKAPPAAPQPEPLKPKPGPQPLARSEAEPTAPPQPPSPPADPDFKEFKEGQTIEQNAPAPAAPAGSGARIASAEPTTGSGGPRRQATYDVKDYIRIQIERHWRFDADTVDARNWSVAIHLVINPDGSIDRADIVDDPRLVTDARFRAFAISARDAALVSAPLVLPEGIPRADLDLTLRFDPREALR